MIQRAPIFALALNGVIPEIIRLSVSLKRIITREARLFHLRFARNDSTESRGSRDLFLFISILYRDPELEFTRFRESRAAGDYKG